MLYLRRDDDDLVLTIEHRASKSPEPIALRLVDGDDPHLQVVSLGSKPRLAIDEGVMASLNGSALPLTRTALRTQLGVRNHDLGVVLAHLEKNGRIVRTAAGWRPT